VAPPRYAEFYLVTVTVTVIGVGVAYLPASLRAP
jgi:hypothetical protein